MEIDRKSEKERIHQACAVPYRRGADGVEFCLITSANSGQWVFPKGLIDPDETPESTALNESWEEAGLRGQIVGEPLGVYQYRKWNRDLNVQVFLMHVQTVADQWEEAYLRQRQWAALRTAQELIQRDYLLTMLSLANQRLTTGDLP